MCLHLSTHLLPGQQSSWIGFWRVLSKRATTVHCQRGRPEDYSPEAKLILCGACKGELPPPHIDSQVDRLRGGNRTAWLTG